MERKGTVFAERFGKDKGAFVKGDEKTAVRGWTTAVFLVEGGKKEGGRRGRVEDKLKKCRKMVFLGNVWKMLRLVW